MNENNHGSSIPLGRILIGAALVLAVASGCASQARNSGWSADSPAFNVNPMIATCSPGSHPAPGSLSKHSAATRVLNFVETVERDAANADDDAVALDDGVSDAPASSSPALAQVVVLTQPFVATASPGARAQRTLTLVQGNRAIASAGQRGFFSTPMVATTSPGGRARGAQRQPGVDTPVNPTATARKPAPGDRGDAKTEQTTAVVPTP